MQNAFERRARELMLNAIDTIAYLRLMRDSERGEYHVTCPDCGERFQTYETETLRHIRACMPLRVFAARELQGE